MTVKVTPKQFKLLLDNPEFIGERGLKLTMSGRSVKKILPDLNSLNEGKMFKVNLWFGAYDTVALVYAHSSSSAMTIAGKMFPKARVFSATEFKGRLC